MRFEFPKAELERHKRVTEAAALERLKQVSSDAGAAEPGFTWLHSIAQLEPSGVTQKIVLQSQSCMNFQLHTLYARAGMPEAVPALSRGVGADERRRSAVHVPLPLV